MKKHLPNLLTCLNLLCGCIGVVLVIQQKDYKTAAYLMWLAGIFDFFDGFAARGLKINSNFGKELDSLADMVTFGLLPSTFIFSMLQELDISGYLPFFAFLIAIASALRLAKFNIDTEQTDQFIGLPTPANSIFISGLAWLYEDYSVLFISTQQLPIFLIILIILSAYLLVSNIPMLAFKFKNFKWTDNQLKYLFIILSILAIIILKFQAISLIIVIYILFSIFNNFMFKKG